MELIKDSMKSVILLLLICIGQCEPYKILGIFHTMSKSHFIVGGALMKGLAEKGHDVTMISSFPQSKPLKNYRDISISGINEVMRENNPNIFFELNQMSRVESYKHVFGIGLFMTNYTLQHENVKKFLNSPNEHFDVVVMQVFANEAHLGIANHFKAPVIGFGTFGAIKWNTDMVGSPSPLSYIAHPLLTLTDRMTFFQRVYNTLFHAFEHFYMHYFYLPVQTEMYNAVFPDPKPPLHILRTNVSLVFLNTHFSLSYPRPYVPNMIEIGGVQVNRVVKDLPENMKTFLDSADHGAIYFSMGSNIRSSQFPIEKRQAILSVFSKLKQKVLWKWDEENLPGKSDNVFISNWFPQDDILAHPNVNIFITHGGLLSSTEAIYHGVPIIGIPMFGDQHLNMARAEQNHYGISISYRNLTEASLTWALQEMLGNDKYQKQAQLMSSRYRDQPMTPLETGIYWTEYVARHKGAPHLRSTGLDFNWFAYHSLDVFAFLLFSFLAGIYGIKTMLGLMCAKNVTKSVNNKKKN